MAVARLASGEIIAGTESQLVLQLAAHGVGASQWMLIHQGAPVSFTSVAPGAYTACVVPLPRQVSGAAGLSYLQRHADKLRAFCRQVTVAADPEQQAVSIPVVIPAYIPDGSGSSGKRYL
jgi:hypothetical protein